MSDWKVFTGNPQKPHAETPRLNRQLPPWRNFSTHAQHRGRTYLPSQEEIQLVNAALHLRRPLLVTGTPGCGKSSLAYAIAEELELMPVLKWPINSRSTLTEGLYHYDAIARLRDANLEQRVDQSAAATRRSNDISRYLQLQWLGTALAAPRPRVLLIDEIDKADLDLPNDLLHVLEEGSFAIPELARVADEQEEVLLRTCETTGTERIAVKKGVVSCGVFPIIVMTSNGERELPLAFHRRCLRLDLKEPTADRLIDIVNSHLGELLAGKDQAAASVRGLVEEFVRVRQQGRLLATDQLLNLVYLLLGGETGPQGQEAAEVQKQLFRGLDE